MDNTINSFNTPAMMDQDSRRFGFFPAAMMNKAPMEETRTASKGFIETIVSINFSSN